MKGGPTIALSQATDGQSLSPKELDMSLKPIRDIRDAVGMDMQIANDGHGKWTLPVAIRIAQAMEPYEMMWQEDLMPLHNPDALARLQASTKTPVCISERLLTRWQLRQFIENGSARIVMPDLIWTGGISETHKVAILASAHQVPFAPHDASGPVNIFACARRYASARRTRWSRSTFPASTRAGTTTSSTRTSTSGTATCTRRNGRVWARG